MEDLENVDLMVARGKYSTIRAEHEDAKKELQLLCSALMALPQQILKNGQDDEMKVDSAFELVKAAGEILKQLDRHLLVVKQLEQQRAELKLAAWPKK
jgi:hypothetical protein